MLRNGYGTYRESDKNGYTDKKQSKTKGKPKENTQKKKPYTTKSKPKEQAIQQQTEKYPYLPKRNHGRLALGYANSAENGGIAGISHRRAGFGADIVTNFVEMT